MNNGPDLWRWVLKGMPAGSIVAGGAERINLFNSRHDGFTVRKRQYA